MNVENELKRIIIDRYGSVRAFTQSVQIPYSTVDNMLKRGVGGCGFSTVLKICNALGIDVDALNSGVIKEKAAPAKSEGAQAHYNVPAEYFTLSAANRQAVDILIKNLARTQYNRLDSIASDLTQTTQGAFPCPTYKK